MDEQRREPDESTGVEGGPSESVLTLVCLTCGQEYYFSGGQKPGRMSCEKCQGVVFREFLSPSDDDEAARDFADSTERDLDADDAEGDSRPGDVIEL